MALTPGGSILVKSPRCTEPSKFGLLSVVTPFTPTDPHWQSGGFEFEDDLCGDGTETFLDNCPPASGFTKPAQRGLGFCTADPFVAVGSFDCSPTGRSAGEAFEIARKRLLAWEGRQVEKSFWTGVTSNGTISPSMALGSPECGIEPVDVNTAGAVDPVTAISLLETALANEVVCGGLLHVPFSLMAYLKAHHQLDVQGDELYSPSGYRVVAGSGYDGTGPSGAAPAAGTTWIFATGPMLIARSNVMMVPDTLAEGVDRRINSITVRAERVYAVGVSCALLAVRTSLTCACV